MLRRRAGLTLVEMMVVIVLLGIISAALTVVLSRQQRFYASAADMAVTRDAVREAITLLPGDLRAISPAGGDIYAMTDTSIDFRLPVGTTVICTKSSSTQFTITPVNLASKAALTVWPSAPVRFDSLLIFDEGATTSITDDNWRRNALASNPGSGSCPTTTGFTSTSAEAATGMTFTVSTALPTTVVTGSVVRVFRRARYTLRQAASGRWYIYYFDCPAATCGTAQPISGPFMAATSTAGTTGLRFAYLDSVGTATTNRLLVSRIQLTARARTASPVRMPGRRNDYYQDSLTATIALRNRP